MLSEWRSRGVERFRRHEDTVGRRDVLHDEGVAVDVRQPARERATGNVDEAEHAIPRAVLRLDEHPAARGVSVHVIQAVLAALDSDMRKERARVRVARIHAIVVVGHKPVAGHGRQVPAAREARGPRRSARRAPRPRAPRGARISRRPRRPSRPCTSSASSTSTRRPWSPRRADTRWPIPAAGCFSTGGEQSMPAFAQPRGRCPARKSHATPPGLARRGRLPRASVHRRGPGWQPWFGAGCDAVALIDAVSSVARALRAAVQQRPNRHKHVESGCTRGSRRWAPPDTRHGHTGRPRGSSAAS